MNRFILAVLIFLCIGALHAEQSHPVFYVGAGLSEPIGPSTYGAFSGTGLDIGIRDTYKGGFGFMVGGGVEINPRTELLGRIGYQKYEFTSDKLLKKVEDELYRLTGGASSGLDLTLSAEGGNLTLLEFLADIKFNLSSGPDSRITPYLLGGIGMTNAKVEATELKISATFMGETESDSVSAPEQKETKLGFNLGGGLQFQASPTVSVFIEGRFAQVAVEGDAISYVPIMGGLRILLGN